MTPLWTGPELQAATGGTRSGPPFAADGVSIDTRTLRRGDLFVALHGDTDGHAHVRTALDHGAAGAMIDAPSPEPAGGASLLHVPDTGHGLTALGRAGRARFAGPVVAVTGSVGKTTTKEMLRLCLSQGGTAHAAHASHNNHWGVPLTLARLPPAATACVVEIGMNHAGEIAPLARLAEPSVAVITTIAAAHLGQLGSLEAIADEKAEIARGLRPDGVAILPADTPMLDRLRRHTGGHRVLTFGAAAGADATLCAWHAGPEGSAIEARICGHMVAFRLHAPGRHMALNALAALLASHAAGLDVRQAGAALERFAAGPGRGLRRAIELPGGTALVLDESYNASAASIRAALAVLGLQPAARRIVVLGDMRELGGHSAAEHRDLAGPVAETADLLFTCGPEMRRLHDAAPARLHPVHAADSHALAPSVAAAIRPGDAILVKGSNGSRMAVVIAALDALGHAAAPMQCAGRT